MTLSTNYLFLRIRRFMTDFMCPYLNHGIPPLVPPRLQIPNNLYMTSCPPFTSSWGIDPPPRVQNSWSSGRVQLPHRPLGNLKLPLAQGKSEPIGEEPKSQQEDEGHSGCALAWAQWTWTLILFYFYFVLFYVQTMYRFVQLMYRLCVYI